MNITRSGKPCANWKTRSGLSKMIKDENGVEKKVPMNYCRNGNKDKNKLNTRKKVSLKE